MFLGLGLSMIHKQKKELKYNIGNLQKTDTCYCPKVRKLQQNIGHLYFQLARSPVSTPTFTTFVTHE